jgi:hypothetical protein
MKIGRMDIYSKGIVFEGPRSVINLGWKHLLNPKYLKIAIRIIFERGKPIEFKF